jgi:Helicase HerA, central domain
MSVLASPLRPWASGRVLAPAAAASSLPELALLLLGLALLLSLALGLTRAARRGDRRYVRLRIVPYQGDAANVEALVAMFEALHKRLLRRWWRRLLAGQPSLSLEAHLGREAWLAVSCPVGSEAMVLAALRVCYPNCSLELAPQRVGSPPALLRLKKEQPFTKGEKAIERFGPEREREPFMNRLLLAMAASGGPAFVQLAMTPTSIGFERRARRTLFFVDVRVVAAERSRCEEIASALRAEVAESRLVERGTTLRHGLLRLYGGRVRRGEGNPLPCTRKGVYTAAELAAMWQLPSPDFLAVPMRRGAIPLAPAPAAIMRPRPGLGTLIDAYGPVSIHLEMRRWHTAVVGASGQGKTSYLVASLIEDLPRPRCAVILLDPKGDAATAALEGVPRGRACTMLDLTNPAVPGVLCSDPPQVDLDRIIGGAEVLIVKGARGAITAAAAAALMQPLLGMLDAALARQRERLAPGERVTVALKVDDAPLLIDSGFAETMAEKRHAELETVACWQTDAQWSDRELRSRLETLFAHRVYFATASVEEARRSARLTMAQFSDLVRPGMARLSTLGHPDARLRLPMHHAIACWATPAGRQLPFVGRTLPPPIDA